jgi:membrane protein implicated in regulation of membrane protease activity
MRWAWWAVVVVLLLVAEGATATLAAAMAAGGAVVAGLLAAIGAPLYAQLLAFVVASVGLIGFVRPLMSRSQRGPGLRTGAAALVGARALVTHRVDSVSGRINVDGDVWSARALDPDAVFEPGASVDIAAIDGATAIVV